MSAAPVQFRGGVAYHWATVLATVRMHLEVDAIYPLNIIQQALFPVLSYVTWRVTYTVSGRSTVEGVSPSAFLLVGMVGLLTWRLTVLGSGYSIESERSEGTIGSLFLTPVNRASIVLGHGLAAFVGMLPTYTMIIIVGFMTGTRLNITDPLALAISLLAVVVASLATGFALAGLFILSRRGNLIANSLQSPIYLLAGFIVPRTELSGWLRPLSNVIPAGPATDALRASTLSGATLVGVVQSLAFAFGTSALWALIGYVSLRRVEYAAKRSGQLELY